MVCALQAAAFLLQQAPLPGICCWLDAKAARHQHAIYLSAAVETAARLDHCTRLLADLLQIPAAERDPTGPDTASPRLRGIELLFTMPCRAPLHDLLLADLTQPVVNHPDALAAATATLQRYGLLVADVRLGRPLLEHLHNQARERIAWADRHLQASWACVWYLVWRGDPKLVWEGGGRGRGYPRLSSLPCSGG